MAHVRQSQPDAGLGLQVGALKTFYVVLACHIRQSSFHIRQSRPLSSKYGTYKIDSSLGLQVGVLKTFEVVLYFHFSGQRDRREGKTPR